MPPRRLDPDERALWRKVTAGVRPLGGRSDEIQPEPAARHAVPRAAMPLVPAAPAPPVIASARPKAQDTLDGGWDRRLRRGMVAPDRTLDLHGHTLAGAHATLEAALSRALADDVRLLLLITGRPPRERADGGPRRGAISAAVRDWLAASPYSGRIAAVRAAHPRHGGTGAIYVILRRRREPV